MNEGLLLLANFIDILTCHTLDYVEPQHGHDSRAIAAADLVDSGAVENTLAMGYYHVQSRTERVDSKPLLRTVTVDGDEVWCNCLDEQTRRNHKKRPIICQHIIAAAMVEAMRQTWGDTPEQDEQDAAMVAATQEA